MTLLCAQLCPDPSDKKDSLVGTESQQLKAPSRRAERRIALTLSVFGSQCRCSVSHVDSCAMQSNAPHNTVKHQQFLELVLTSHEFCFWHLGFSQAPEDLTPVDRPVEELFCCEKGEGIMHGKMALKDATVSHCSCCFFFFFGSFFECDRLSKKPIAFWKKISVPFSRAFTAGKGSLQDIAIRIVPLALYRSTLLVFIYIYIYIFFFNYS